LFLFLCLAAVDNGGRPLAPDVTGVLPPRFCALDPDAGGVGRWPGTKPLPGVRRWRAPSSDGVWGRTWGRCAMMVAVLRLDRRELQLHLSIGVIGSVHGVVACKFARQCQSSHGQFRRRPPSWRGRWSDRRWMRPRPHVDPSDALALTLAAALRDLFPGDEERDRSRFWPSRV
jgi:hypothetical protein